MIANRGPQVGAPSLALKGKLKSEILDNIGHIGNIKGDIDVYLGEIKLYL